MHPCTWRPAGRALPALLLAALGAAAGCVGGADSQTINGRVDRTSFGAQVIGARVVAGDEVIATTPVASDGTFRLDIPAGAGYRLEILAADGVHPYRAADVGGVAHFDVCAPSAPWDLGMVTEHGCTDPDVPPPEPGCDGGGHPPWCPPGVPDEECNDPCQWDPEACGDPCALYPEACDPCAMNPEL
ncbi:MAG: carboxypeptidase regulatory-like domain-containing protein, partial [Myxococcales bacterium]|nr:carboxypeptidase regulatory-like domain-containing protein [Myxococcales bacterium]